MRLSYLFLIGLICSCHSQERPKDVLSHEQLSALLIDVYLAEARTETIPKMRDSTIRYFIPFEKELLQARGISDSVMRITYSYYMNHPKELESVYDAIIDTLALRENTVNRIPYKDPQNNKNPVNKAPEKNKFKQLEKQDKKVPLLKKPGKKLESK